MMQRVTIQSGLVLDAVRRLHDHATAEAIYAEIIKQHPHISRGTVYRNLNRLAQTAQILRVEVPNGPDRFDHQCHPHYHVQCQKCGRLFDVDIPYMEGLENGIRDRQGFLFTGHRILFLGVCPDCLKAPGDEREDR